MTTAIWDVATRRASQPTGRDGPAAACFVDQLTSHLWVSLGAEPFEVLGPEPTGIGVEDALDQRTATGQRDLSASFGCGQGQVDGGQATAHDDKVFAPECGQAVHVEIAGVDPAHMLRPAGPVGTGGIGGQDDVTGGDVSPVGELHPGGPAVGSTLATQAGMA